MYLEMESAFPALGSHFFVISNILFSFLFLVDALAMLTISKDPVEKIVEDLETRVKELYKKK